MTTAVQHRRGTTAEHATFTGLEGEVTIDTTKDTAVIHDGVLAGGYPLAKESLANVNPSTLTAIDGASTASDDLFLVFDTSTLSMKKITRAELNNAMEADALANVSITGGTINGTAIGGTTAAAGAFTTLSASGAVTLSGGTANGVTYLNGSKVVTSGSALTFDGSLFSVVGSSVLASATGTGQYTSAYLYSNATTARAASFKKNYDSPYDFVITSAETTATNADIVFKTNQSSERMRLTSTGLGIGTSSPLASLDVYKVTSAVGYVRTANQTLKLTADDSGSRVDIANAASGPLSFTIGTTERVRIDSSGNLGLGVTPSAWAGFSAFQASLGSVAGNTSEFDISHNAYFDGAWKYIANGFATNHYQTSGTYVWRTAPSGTAGNAISFTQAMTLDANGNLGLGTTYLTNSAGYKTLSLNGTTGGQLSFQTGGVGKHFIFSSATDLNFYNSVAGNLIFSTNSTERVRIDSSGNVGIGGAPDSNSTLHIFDGTSSLNDYTVHIEAYSPALVFQDISGGPSTDFALQADNSVLMFRYGDASTSTQLASEAMRIDSSGHLIVPAGVTLGTSAGTYNAANTLDDYEEGTWNASLYDDTGLKSSHTTDGTYVKVGNLVYVTARIFDGSGFTATGQVYCNLPFTPGSTDVQASCVLPYVASAGNAVSAFIVDGNIKVRFGTTATTPYSNIVSTGAVFAGTGKRIYLSLVYSTV